MGYGFDMGRYWRT